MIKIMVDVCGEIMAFE